MRARLIPTTVVLVSVLVAGCGGSDDKKSAQQVVRDFVTAVNEKDGKAFCTEIATREYVEKVTAAQGDSAIQQCESQIKQIRQPRYKVSKLVKTTVDGDRATVVAELAQQGRVRRQLFRLVKEDGDFRLTSGTTAN